jgi:hypothetical protein
MLPWLQSYCCNKTDFPLFPCLGNMQAKKKIPIYIMALAVVSVYSFFWLYQASKIKKATNAFIEKVNHDNYGFVNIDVEKVRIGGYFSLRFIVKYKNVKLQINEEMLRKNPLIRGQAESTVTFPTLKVKIPVLTRRFKFYLPKEISYLNYRLRFNEEDTVATLKINRRPLVDFILGCNFTCVLNDKVANNFSFFDFKHSGYLIVRNGDNQLLASSDRGMLYINKKPSNNGSRINLNVKSSGLHFENSYFADSKRSLSSVFKSPRNQNSFADMYDFIALNNEKLGDWEFELAMEYSGPFSNKDLEAGGQKSIDLVLHRLDLGNYVFSLSGSGSMEMSRYKTAGEFGLNIAGVDELVDFFVPIYNIMQDTDKADIVGTYYNDVKEDKSREIKLLSSRGVDLVNNFIKKLSATTPEDGSVNIRLAIDNRGISIGNYNLAEVMTMWLDLKQQLQ